MNIMEKPVMAAPAAKRPLVLAVDDDRTQLMMLVSMIEELGCSVLEAGGGREALEIIGQRKADLDAVLLDRGMPDIDGIEVVGRLKEDRSLRNLPVIMQTGADQPNEIKEGIDAGVFYYLTKPVDQSVLKSVLAAAIRESDHQRLLSDELATHKSSFGLIDRCEFRLQTLPEAEQLARFLANCYPDPERAIVGLAALLINAVEHGNLGISYDEKGDLVERGTWREEVMRRAGLPENKNKWVEAVFVKTAESLEVTICDQGEGFDWRNYLAVDPSRANDNHGRGIAQANMVSFDRLSYNDAGNEVTASVGFQSPLDW